VSYLDSPWFSTIERPSRYIGAELNSAKKDKSKIETFVALAFPDVYEVGMSHVGLKILYNILNKEEWLAAERVFCPWLDLEEKLRQSREPLVSLETGKPLGDFDIVGFSLQHELCFTNVLTMMELGRIPLLRSERTGRDPLVIGGGPSCFNPEPVADFFDLFLVGDGEESLPKLCRVIRQHIDLKAKDRDALLRLSSEVKGVYVPGLFHVDYERDGRISSVKSIKEGYNYVEKAVLPDLDLFPFPDAQVIPYTQLVHDRLSLEIARGCTRGCRFCQAGMIYRPVRERKLGSVLDSVHRALEKTGYDEVSLLSLSTGDYTCIEELLRNLMDRYACEKVALSLPSLRVDTVSPMFMEQIKRVRKTGFTLAVEAGSERLRRVINKGLTRDEIISMAREVYKAGWNLIKLYFMVGLPYEEEVDIHETVRLAREIARLAPGRKGGEHLTVSVSTFVPKAHTPFMWAAQASPNEAREKISLIQTGLRKDRAKVKWNPTELSWLEGIFSRGDRRLSDVVLEAWKRGARFDGWGEIFKKSIWEEAFSFTGLDPSFYLERRRDCSEIFPWDHIRSGVSKEYLWQEWEKAKKEQSTPDCRKGCLDCGVCDHVTILPVLHKSPPSGHQIDVRREGEKNKEPGVYRLTFKKMGPARFLGHLEMVQVFLRAFRRIHLPILYSGGFHPMPKVSFTQALPVGTESLEESMEIHLTSTIGPDELRERVNRELPDQLKVLSVQELPGRGRKTEFLKESHFIITISNGHLSSYHMEAYEKAQNFLVNKTGKAGTKSIDAKKIIGKILLISPDVIELELKHDPGPQLKPADIVKAIFHLDDSSLERMRILKTRQLLGPLPEKSDGG
jgi:radical SAM family uncharacterized protein/radical SAM-linked protein